MLSSCQYVNKLAICKLLHRDQVETSEVMCEAYSEISLLGVSWLRTEQRYLLSCCGFSGDERTSGKINIARRRVAGNCTLVHTVATDKYSTQDCTLECGEECKWAISHLDCLCDGDPFTVHCEEGGILRQPQPHYTALYRTVVMNVSQNKKQETKAEFVFTSLRPAACYCRA